MFKITGILFVRFVCPAMHFFVLRRIEMVVFLGCQYCQWEVRGNFRYTGSCPGVPGGGGFLIHHYVCLLKSQILTATRHASACLESTGDLFINTKPPQYKLFPHYFAI